MVARNEPSIDYPRVFQLMCHVGMLSNILVEGSIRQKADHCVRYCEEGKGLEPLTASSLHLVLLISCGLLCCLKGGQKGSIHGASGSTCLNGDDFNDFETPGAAPLVKFKTYLDAARSDSHRDGTSPQIRGLNDDQTLCS